jgi:putative colanic acid biosynthesis acetyltransferase WcaF
MDELSVNGIAAEIYDLVPVHIGSNTVVFQRSYLCTVAHDYTKPEFLLFSCPITIGDSAWIAACAFVDPWISVDEGTILGVRSVVTKDIPPWMVCAGNPCRVIKPRRLDDLCRDRTDTDVAQGGAEKHAAR